MKLLHTSIFSALTAALLFSGCSSTSSDSPTTATPPPATTDAATTTPAPVDPAPAPVDTSSQTVTPPTDSGSSTVPLDSLPKKKGYPYAIKTKWPGLVKSPYAQDKTLVDVSSLASGSPARCPHTGKIFIVP